MVGKLGADFVACLPDHRAERQSDPPALGALPRHGIDQGAGDVPCRTFPARMRSADHARHRIDSEQRTAVGRQHPQRQPGNPGDKAVTFRPPAARPAGRNGQAVHLSRMGLCQGNQSLRREMNPDAASVFIDVARVVIGPEATVEITAPPAGAALPGEEPVLHGRHAREKRRDKG